MTYTSDPGHRVRAGQKVQSRSAKAAAPSNAGVDRNRTTFGPLAEPTTSAINLAHSEGLSSLTTAASTTSEGVTSGNCVMPSSPVLQRGKRGHDVVTNPFFVDDSCTDVSRDGRGSWNLNWAVVGGWLAILTPWLIVAAILVWLN